MTWPLTTWPISVTGWDAGISYRWRRSVDPTDLAVDVPYVSDQVLRVVNDGEDYEFIARAIKAATQDCEDTCLISLMPQTHELTLSGFPSGYIELPRPPFIAVTSLAYVDGDGEAQELAVSPAEFLTIPSGAYQPAKLLPLSGASWPSALSQSNAVVITYLAGHANSTLLPPREVAGICVMVAELYKQRTLSVQGVSNSPAVLSLERFWPRRY